MNSYAYAVNSPVTASDPEGTVPCRTRNPNEDLCPNTAPKVQRPAVVDQYQDAKDLYFGQEPAGYSRYRKPTNAKAPGNGIIIVRFFISGEFAAGGVLFGATSWYELAHRSMGEVNCWFTSSWSAAPRGALPGAVARRQCRP